MRRHPRRQAAVDRELGTRDEGRLVAREVDHERGDLLGAAQAAEGRHLAQLVERAGGIGVQVGQGAHHGGVGEARVDGVAADRIAATGTVQRDALGEDPRRALGRPVRDEIGLADEARHARHHHDGRGRRRPQEGQGRLGAEEQALDVERLHAAPLRERAALDVARDAAPGVVHQHVQAALVATQLRERGVPVLAHGDVEPAVARRLAERPGQRLAGLVGDVGEQHAGPLGHERASTRRADARRGSGHQGELRIEAGHARRSSEPEAYHDGGRPRSCAGQGPGEVSEGRCSRAGSTPRRAPPRVRPRAPATRLSRVS